MGGCLLGLICVDKGFGLLTLAHEEEGMGSDQTVVGKRSGAVDASLVSPSG